MPHWRTPITANAQPDHVATTYMPVYWLVLTQVVFGVLTLFALLVFVASLPVYFMQLQTVCHANSCAAWQLTPATAQALHAHGISVQSYVLFRLINTLASALVGFIVAGVLVSRRSREWMALLVAFMLVMLGIVEMTNTVTASASARTLAAFSATLRDEVDLGQLSEQLIEVVQETMQPERVSLWLRPPAHDSKL
jgi:hypothetical protein